MPEICTYHVAFLFKKSHAVVSFFIPMLSRSDISILVELRKSYVNKLNHHKLIYY